MPWPPVCGIVNEDDEDEDFNLEDADVGFVPDGVEDDDDDDKAGESS